MSSKGRTVVKKCQRGLDTEAWLLYVTDQVKNISGAGSKHMKEKLQSNTHMPTLDLFDLLDRLKSQSST